MNYSGGSHPVVVRTHDSLSGAHAYARMRPRVPGDIHGTDTIGDRSTCEIVVSRAKISLNDPIVIIKPSVMSQ